MYKNAAEENRKKLKIALQCKEKTNRYKEAKFL